MYSDESLLYVDYVFEKLIDVNAIIEMCDVRPLYACAYSGLCDTIVIIRGNDLCCHIACTVIA